MLVKPEAPRPISAGITPDRDWSSRTASTLKLVNVPPPPQLRIADIGSVECKNSFHATLPVDRELLRKIGSPA
jgi:hypothetical protein